MPRSLGRTNRRFEMPAWKQYQQDIAKLFRSLGCDAEVDELVQGARARHRIDVWVTFSHFGFEHRWVIECKKWRSRIPKEKVLTLKSIVEDVGADRGILVADAGFQRGAKEVAASSNILLTGFDVLRKTTREDLLTATLLKLERRADQLSAEIASQAFVVERTGAYISRAYPNPAFGPEAGGRAMGALGVLRWGIKSARFDEYPAVVSSDWPGDKVVFAHDLEDFVSSASEILHNLDQWWAEAKRTASKRSALGKRET